MKKLTVLTLTIILILTFTITSYGAGATPPARDLRSATVASLDSDEPQAVIPMMIDYYTDVTTLSEWNQETFNYVINTSYTIDQMNEVHGTALDNVLLIGLYHLEPNLDGEAISALVKPYVHTITPNIYGITADSDVCVFQGTGMGNWERIDQANITVGVGTITVSTESSITPFAIVVDKTTLLNNGVTPPAVIIPGPISPPFEDPETELLDEWNITGIDSTGATVTGVAYGKAGTVEGLGVAFAEFDDSDLMNSMLPEGAENLVVLHGLEIEMEEATVFPVTITFDYPNVNKDSKVYIFHLPLQGEWELIEATVCDGKVTATFDSLSPVIFLLNMYDSAKIYINNFFIII